MDVHDELAQLRTLVDQARGRPRSSTAVLDRTEVLARLDTVQVALAEALAESRRVLDERDTLLADARAEADRVVAAAHEERERLVADADVHQDARSRADRLLGRARAEAADLRREADDYVDAKLATFEITLQRTTEAVQRGRASLAGESPYAGISADDPEGPDATDDAVALPEHLDG